MKIYRRTVEKTMFIKTRKAADICQVENINAWMKRHEIE